MTKRMTEGQFKRRLAGLILTRASDYLPSYERKTLEKVINLEDDLATRWQVHVRLGNDPNDPDWTTAAIGAFPCIDGTGHFEPMNSSYASVTDKDAEASERFAKMAVCIARLVKAGQKLVDAYNRGAKR